MFIKLDLVLPRGLSIAYTSKRRDRSVKLVSDRLKFR